MASKSQACLLCVKQDSSKLKGAKGRRNQTGQIETHAGLWCWRENSNKLRKTQEGKNNGKRSIPDFGRGGWEKIKITRERASGILGQEGRRLLVTSSSPQRSRWRRQMFQLCPLRTPESSACPWQITALMTL